MALKLTRKGDTSYLQDHNLLKNTGLNDQHPINAITGLKETLDNEDKRIKDIETKIESGEIVSGGGTLTPSSLKYTSLLEYNGTKLVKETYTGDVNKVVRYTYDKDNIIKKTVTRNDKVVEASYKYDNNNNLIKVVDNGVDDIYIAGVGGTSKYISQIDSINYSELTEIINYNSISDLNELEVLLSSELLIKGGEGSKSNIIITQDKVEVLNVVIPPGEIQKYVLGTSKNIVVYASGSLNYEFTLNGVKRSDGSSSTEGVIDKAEVEKIVNEILDSKLDDNTLNLAASIKRIQLNALKTHIKYDKYLKLPSNYSSDLFVDANLDHIEERGE